MARRIPLAKIGDYSREKYEKLLREVVFETDRQLKDGSPVDTGRLRLSWSIGENNTPGYDPGPQSAIPDITPPRRAPPSPEGYFQTQVRLTFETFEDL
jgi:hypothetical protein